MKEQLPYDKTSKTSILMHAQGLLGKSLHNLYPEATAALSANAKGRLGQYVEKLHFRYEPNNASEPDFADAGVELKCTPLKTLKNGSLVSKERLVLNVIDYVAEATVDFLTSSFWKKNAELLLMFYLHVAKVNPLDLIFKIVRLWTIPDEDWKIFQDDWAIIHHKISNGRAHELHEGDTFYLATCTKGSRKKAEMRSQFGTSIKAPQRAYSIKSAYLNQIILDSMDNPCAVSGLKMTPAQRKKIEKKKAEYGSIVRNIGEYKEGQTFEQLVLSKFAPFIGKSVAEIEESLGVTISKSPKAISYALCRAILGVKERKIAEFEKADVLLKTVRLEPSGALKESMSFKLINYFDIVDEEEWAESAWYDVLAHRFFFVIFRKSKTKKDSDAILEKVFFWAMPVADVKKAEGYWRDTRDKVRAGDYEHFIKISEHDVCHVRPKAKNSKVRTPTPQGGLAKKYCYWLNAKYILEVINGVK